MSAPQPSAREVGSLSRGETARALRAFIVSQGLWGAWSQMAGVGAAVMTGYVLSLGGDASFVALMTSITTASVVGQLLSPIIGRRVANKKRFILTSRVISVLFRGSVLAVPFLLAPSWQLGALVVLLTCSLFFLQLLSPFFGSWQANTIPEGIRARFTSRQTIVASLAAMATGFLVGGFLDSFPEGGKQTGFLVIFAVSVVVGLLSTWTMGRAPYPRAQAPPGEDPRDEPAPSEEAPDADGNLRVLLRPFLDTNFRRTAAFYGLWSFSGGLTGPFYSVFMIDQLQISYTVISLLTALATVSAIVGYRLWAGLIDRFGAKPLMQILLVPHAVAPLFWIFNRPDAYGMIPVALALDGITSSGLSIASTPLLYSLLPRGDQKATYLASWSVSINLIHTAGLLMGSFLARVLDGTQLELFGTSLGNLQIIFLIGAAARLIPLVLLRTVRETKAISASALLGHIFRGNLLRYGYNAAIYRVTRSDQRRARAALGLGKSASPLALRQLKQALGDASPIVRRHAAAGLGETGSESAVAPLIRELRDPDSDIRGEAAEALGRLGFRRGVDLLIESLTDDDPWVQAGAIRGLAQAQGAESRELLFWHFSDRFNVSTFPTLVDMLSGLGDTRVAIPALQRLASFHLPRVRLQLLNGVCRALGAGDEFYRLLSREEVGRSAALERMLRRAARMLTSTSALPPEARERLRPSAERLLQACQRDDSAAMAEAAVELSEVLDGSLTVPVGDRQHGPTTHMLVQAMRLLLRSPAHQDLPDAQAIFLSVCLSRLGALLREEEG